MGTFLVYNFILALDTIQAKVRIATRVYLGHTNTRVHFWTLLPEPQIRRTADHSDPFSIQAHPCGLVQNPPPNTDHPTLEVKLERHRLKAITQGLMAGGTESSAVTVEWAVSELMRKPKFFNRATEELDRVIGKERWVEEKDIVNLPFIDAIVKETMRLHPVSPTLVPRMAREDCKVAGYDIPKGTRVLVNVWTIGRDPALWGNPNEFYPERFLRKLIDVRGHDFELLPFGTGRRMCPGISLGLKVIQSSLANLLHGFSWKLPGNMSNEELNMEEIFGLSTPKKFPLQVVAQPRLSPTSL